ncbi:MAG: hypothetical protein WCL02_04990 [bacterium]
MKKLSITITGYMLSQLIKAKGAGISFTGMTIPEQVPEEEKDKNEIFFEKKDYKALIADLDKVSNNIEYATFETTADLVELAVKRDQKLPNY